jgi:uncharacterized membrane protein YcjF (UPF0283 family)
VDEAITSQPVLLDPAQVAEPNPAVAAVPTERPRRRPRWPGRSAFAFGILTPIAVGFGIFIATDHAHAPATVLAYVALVASALAVVLGLVAVIGSWGRGAGIAGLGLGVLANPLVLLYGLETLGGL